MEAVGQLASGVAHDFGNMLTVIAAAVDELEGVDLDSDARSAVGLIREAATKATDLTHQLLAFSRGRVLDVVAVELGDCIASMMPLLIRLVGRGVEVRYEPPRHPLWALTDQPSFELAIVNPRRQRSRRHAAGRAAQHQSRRRRQRPIP